MLMLSLTTVSLANTDGRKIMENIEKLNSGFKGSTSQMKMTLIDAYGKQVERKMKTITKEDGQNNEDKSITEFVKPLDVKGTKLLTWTQPKDTNKLWLYLPRFKRVKKINSSGQAGSFMGSEFSYEDIAGHQIDKYTYRLLEENEQHWVIESTPTKDSGYSKTITTYSKKYAIPVKTQYFDRKGDLLKVSTATDPTAYKVATKTIYYPERVEMKNVQNKKASVIEWEKRQIGVAHPDNKFKSHKLQ